MFMDWAMKYFCVNDCQQLSETDIKIYCYIYKFDSCIQNWYYVAIYKMTLKLNLENVLTIVKNKYYYCKE